MVLSPVAEIYRRFKRQEQLLDWYEPLPYQHNAFMSAAKFQIFEGGNRSGKTETGLVKLILIGLGQHPTIHRPLPQKIRVVSTVLQEGALNVITNKLRKYVPKKALYKKSWDTAFRIDKRILTLDNGTTFQLMASSQDLDVFRGDDLDIVAFDEEPPEEIYDENITRLADRNGLAYMFMTPHRGLSWSYRRLVKQAGKNPDIEYFYFDTMRNYYINRHEHLKAALTMSQREFKIRILGQRISLEGLVYHPFSEATHVVNAFQLPEGSQLFLGIDFGLHNPTAASLRAIVPGQPEQHYIVDEYYETGFTVSENAIKIGNWLKLKWNKYPLKWIRVDPNSGTQRSEQTNERNVDVFRKALWNAYDKKVPVVLGNKEMGCVDHRINSVLEALTPTIAGAIKLKFFSHCLFHIDELQSYVYRERRDETMNKLERPKEFKNHLMNAMEYVAEANPRMYITVKKLNVIYQQDPYFVR